MSDPLFPKPTKDDFVSVPTPVSPKDGKTHLGSMPLPTLIHSIDRFTTQELAREIDSRQPQATSISLLEWIVAMEDAQIINRLHLFKRRSKALVSAISRFQTKDQRDYELLKRFKNLRGLNIDVQLAAERKVQEQMNR